jgi:hypothetical protein
VDEHNKRQDQPEEPAGPADEYEALRARFLTALRRRPGDTRSLLRTASELSRIMAAQHRMSPKASKDLGENLARVLNRFGDLILPADE